MTFREVTLDGATGARALRIAAHAVYIGKRAGRRQLEEFALPTPREGSLSAMSTTIAEAHVRKDHTNEKYGAEEQPELVEYVQDSTALGIFGAQKEKDEKQLVRKLDRRIIPMIFAMYFFACMYAAYCSTSA